MLTFKIYLGLARRPEADFNISYWASVNDSQAVKISNKARGSGSPGCTTYHHIACCWRHQVLRWWWIWRCCIWGYLAAASVNLMPSNRHRSPFPGAAAWPAHNIHISLLFNLLLLPAHNNHIYFVVMELSLLVSWLLAVLGLFILPSTQYPVPTHCTCHHQLISRKVGSQVILHLQLYKYHSKYDIVIIRNERPRDFKAEHFFPSYFRSPIYIIAEMEKVVNNDYCHH